MQPVGVIARLGVCLVFMVGPAGPTRLDGQEQVLRFERISIQQGLSQSRVNTILQDRKGFLWFGTQEGLDRYDGYGFETFQHDPEDPQSLSHRRVRVLYEDAAGVLWIGTDGGLDRFDRVRETFARHRHDPGDPQSLSHDEIRAIYSDPDEVGVLWIGTRGGGLNRFDRATGTFTRYRHDPTDPRSLSHDELWAICEDRQGRALDRNRRRWAQQIRPRHGNLHPLPP